MQRKQFYILQVIFTETSQPKKKEISSIKKAPFRTIHLFFSFLSN